MAKSRSPFEQMKIKNRDPRDNMFKNPLAGLETDTSPTKNISTSLEGTAGVVPSNKSTPLYAERPMASSILAFCSFKLLRFDVKRVFAS